MRASINTGLTSWWIAARSLQKQRVARVWQWWVGEMQQLMPARVRALIARRQRKIYLLPQNQNITVFEGVPGELTQIGQKGLDRAAEIRPLLWVGGKEIVLLLPPEKILKRSIELPASVGEDLASALELELDRQTPFTADTAYFAYSVRERSSSKKTITVELVLTPKGQLDQLLDRLASAGIAPMAATGLDADGSLHAVNLLPRERVPPQPRLFGKLNAALAVLALALAVTAVAIPLVEKREAIESLEPRVEMARELARAGSAIRDNIERLTTGTTALIDRKDSEPTTIRLLDEITRAIPDDTWIERLEISEQEIQLHGQSPSAAELIALLESNQLFGEPQFRSPVTQIRDSDREQFHISVRWTGAEQ